MRSLFGVSRVLFFFKQKTAYEMRISDWSSDVCSSDLALSPVNMEKLVTFPVETALAGIPGLESTRSISRNGFSQVTVIFDDSTDIYFDRQQVAERLNALGDQLPAGDRKSTRMNSSH